jgi:hypothetical protein
MSPTIVLISFTIILLALFVHKIARRVGDKSQLGINLKKVHCPVCKYEMPAIRKPKNFRQAMWGGWTCPNCTAEVDKWGKVII